ncbi:MAG: IclR family transcriptional regulator [Burkholderiales bacterium]|nr:IclR family transcriptional regulator [Burkholderiales bacterium]
MTLSAVHARKRHAALTERSRETADLTLRLLEFMTLEPAPCGVTELSQQFGTSKATIHRHLRTLANREFVRQDPATLRYEPAIKLFQLGERLRERFGVLGAAREEMTRLREATGQAVTLSTLAEGRVVVLELVQGHTAVEFGIRPGTQMSLHASAHGKVALAFGPAALLERCLRGKLASTGPDAITDPAELKRQVEAIRQQGWATAANEVLFGMNALAAPVFDHRGAFAGALAIVGSTQFIDARPAAKQVALVRGAAARVSATLGWRPE